MLVKFQTTTQYQRRIAAKEEQFLRWDFLSANMMLRKEVKLLTQFYSELRLLQSTQDSIRTTMPTTSPWFELKIWWHLHLEFSQLVCLSNSEKKRLSIKRFKRLDGDRNFHFHFKSRWFNFHFRGSKEFAGPLSEILQHVTLSIVSNGNCTSTQMCSYARNKDTCQSDSGEHSTKDFFLFASKRRLIKMFERWAVAVHR